VSLAAINFDTFVRKDDLTFPSGPLMPTWSIIQNSVVTGGLRHWDVTFLENPAFPWPPIDDFVTFTVLGSQFAPCTDIQFSYIASAAVPEPGTVALAAALLWAGIGAGICRRRKATK